MLKIPQPDADEVRDNAAFASLMWALSRPGSVHVLPHSGQEPVILALVDRECRACADDPDLEAVLRATGATLVPEGLADYACLSLDTDAGIDRFARLAPGDPLYPDTGATVLTRATIGEGAVVRLSGPGIETTTDLRLGGLHPALWPARAQLCRYPQGVEMIFIDGARLVALPRSTHVEVL